MNNNAQRIKGYLSLRAPQTDSLEILSQVVDTIPLVKNPDNAFSLQAIKDLGLPIKNFEREFPSMCFSLATGVGKTRLMGAFISYLYMEKSIKNFFVVAPNLTIYNKLIADFTDTRSPKYVFNGVPAFSTNRPMIITGDNYQNHQNIDSRLNTSPITINIFNISKINREKSSRTKFHSFSEYLGQSYFDYLQSLPDLVLLMDEAHRYKATAGMKIINELQAVLGLELTATAHDEKGKQFANVVYHYALSQAVNDKFVKKPAIVGRSNFDKSDYDASKIEEIKLVDGFKVHEDTKAELEAYASDKNERLVKPFLLVVARDTTHANELKEKIDSDSWLDGRYKGKAIVVHSNQKAVESDENMALLLEVEKASNPVEVVIHVNMLAEGWDVNNLYTIIPLRTADSKTLVEQSIGRGLRLPYGKHTGVEAIDRLHIVAHDRFSEIVKTAEAEGFDFQKIELENDNDIGNKIAIDNTSLFVDSVAKGNFGIKPSTKTEQGTFELTKPNEEEIKLAVKVAEHIEEKIKVIGTVDEIKTPEKIAEIVAEVHQENNAGQLDLDTDTSKLEAITKQLATHYVDMQIKIPPVRVERKAPKTGLTYNRFELNLLPFNDLKPIKQNIIVQELIAKTKKTGDEATFTKQYERLEDYIIVKLMDYLPYTKSSDIDLLDYFANQVVEHIKTYAGNDLEVEKILFFNNENIAKKIFTQAEEHKEVPKIEIMPVCLADDYKCLRTRPSKLLGNKEDGELHFKQRPKVLSKIRSIVFTDFRKCLSTKAKFDSNTERELACVLEDETSVVRWERLSNDQAIDTFQLYYNKEGQGLRPYCPDFVVETLDTKYIIETKAEDNMTSNDVIEKQKVACLWCQGASEFEKGKQNKPWHYLLIPHTEFDPTRSFEKLVLDWSVE